MTAPPGRPRWAAFLDRVDPDYRAALTALDRAMPADFRSLPVDERRALGDAHAAHVPPGDGIDWSDRAIPGWTGEDSVRVRIYRPRLEEGSSLPVVLHIHGGGMWAGSLVTDHAMAMELAAVHQAIVISVDYRRAPEHPAPAAVQDCVAALRWLHSDGHGLQIDTSRVCVHGPSAGGGLAVATALVARDERLPIALLMAIYPMLDDRPVTPSAREFRGLGPAVWDAEANEEAWRWYLGGRAAGPLAAPARATGLAGLPPTFIDVGELDLFRDEDIDFATRLLQAGVPTELHVHPGAFHGSEAVAPDTPISRRILGLRADALRRTFRQPDGKGDL